MKQRSVLYFLGHLAASACACASCGVVVGNYRIMADAGDDDSSGSSSGSSSGGSSSDGSGSGSGSGGGGGGALDARPVGFIEIGPDGSRFQAIDDGRVALRAIAAGSLALLVTGRVLMRRRRAALEGAPSRPRLRRRRQLSQRS